MKQFVKEDLIKCYRENREDRCQCGCEACPLKQAVKKMSFGIDENMETLANEVLEPVMALYGKALAVVDGFVCPKRCQLEGKKLLRLHVKGDTVKLSAVGLQGNDLRLENLEIARAIVKYGKWDLMVLVDTTTTGVGPKSVIVSYSRGKNRGLVMKTVEDKDELEELSGLDKAQLMTEDKQIKI